ncbi:MAG: hypothetical protein J07AB43_10530 [Candidatus Nanosalina sp. J07AB43]|nr:MAG: hypothetical protein J07AB43_10530 [Candidatus Nanosalina sp. J07AB43]
MSKKENKSDESVRQRVVEKQNKALSSSESGYAVLTLALTIGFFGSSAVLMPSDQSVTGMFSGQTELQQPVVQDTEVKAESLSNGEISFVVDSEIFNPNFVQAEIKKIDYSILLDEDTVKRGQILGSSVVPPEESRMSAVEYSLDISGISDSRQIMQSIKNGQKDVRVQGVVSFNVAEQHIEVPFRSGTVL